MANTLIPASPWHEGEKTLQKAVGVSEQMEMYGARAIRPYMPGQHRQFFTQLPFIVAGSVDQDGNAWTTLISGKPGFIQSPSETELTLSAALNAADPTIKGIANGESVALLGIELHTRRRNRMNGTVANLTPQSFSVNVGHSFGNCPQYIQLRNFEFVAEPNEPLGETAYDAENLDAASIAMIRAADTFFVSSYVDLEDDRQVDVSHRGGKNGFVRVDEDGVLTIPDYAGNLYFNTLGNFIKNPKAGLAFPDFETGDMLHLSGEAEVILESPEIAAFEGAERIWKFYPKRVVRRLGALPLRWAFKEFSPNSLMTGSWEEAEARLKADANGKAWRPFRVANIVEESSAIKSFWLEPTDGIGLTRHEAGQHLPIKMNLPGKDKPTLRTYTLSVAPSDSAYRISVKRDGEASTFLHNHISIGDTIEVRAPQGGFTIDAEEERPVVMLAAGVGITPFVSMLRHLLFEGARTRRVRPAWLFQAARTFEERGFDEELESIIENAQGTFRLARILSETDEPRNVQKGLQGRMSVDVLKSVLPLDDYDYYLCGPPGFMKAMYDGLRDLNIADKRIFFESFGPASVERRPDEGAKTTLLPRPSETPVPVAFAASSKEARWEPGSGSLLELAEARGLEPEFSCRIGNCGSCKTKILQGAVTYDQAPEFQTEDNEALICCAVPATSEDGENAPLILDI